MCLVDVHLHCCPCSLEHFLSPNIVTDEFSHFLIGFGIAIGFFMSSKWGLKHVFKLHGHRQDIPQVLPPFQIRCAKCSNSEAQTREKKVQYLNNGSAILRNHIVPSLLRPPHATQQREKEVTTEGTNEPCGKIKEEKTICRVEQYVVLVATAGAWYTSIPN